MTLEEMSPEGLLKLYRDEYILLNQGVSSDLAFIRAIEKELLERMK